ncbi:MAG: hypothetical protein AB7O97_05590 [Planctomycetota bacterium]
MRIHSISVGLFLFSSLAHAQAPVVTTAGDFGVVATLGAAAGFDADAAGTAVTRGLAVHTRVGTSRTDVAGAASLVGLTRNLREGAGVEIREEGRVHNSDPNVGASAGTSNDAPGTAAPTQGAHGVQVHYAGIAAGTNAIVSIHWFGRASAGASVTADVDVDGDGTADFSGAANGGPVTQLLQVTAGATGVTIGITTDGTATLAADGDEAYSGRLVVLVKEGTLPTSCTFTNFGTPCGADLNGTVGSGLDLTLDISNAPADTFGFFLAGDQATTPVQLPVGTCNLLVDGRRWFHHRLIRTDATGAVSVAIPTPRMAVTIAFQAILVSRDPVTQTMTADASNGTELVCQ